MYIDEYTERCDICKTEVDTEEQFNGICNECIEFNRMSACSNCARLMHQSKLNKNYLCPICQVDHSCPHCGNKEFSAHQVVHMDCIVNEVGEWIRNALEIDADNIYHADKPFGPFTCTCCNITFDEIPGRG